jgi:hypothetical protein
MSGSDQQTKSAAPNSAVGPFLALNIGSLRCRNRSGVGGKHGVLPVFGAPGQLDLLAGQEPGRTIPLAVISRQPHCGLQEWPGVA